MTAYQADIDLFAREILDFHADVWQKRVFDDIASYSRVSVKSGQGVGKTSVQAVVILWFLASFPMSRVVATAPTRQQLHDVLWSEAVKWLNRSPLLKNLLIARVLKTSKPV